MRPAIGKRDTLITFQERAGTQDAGTGAWTYTFEGRTLQIVSGPAELGRRDGLEFICEEYSTQGEKP
jgi:hypothetical protein